MAEDEDISPADIERAKLQWEEDAPTPWKGLLDAEPEDEEEDAPAEE